MLGVLWDELEMEAVKNGGDAVVQEKESRAGEMVAGTM